MSVSIYRATRAVVFVDVPYTEKPKKLRGILNTIVGLCLPNASGSLKDSILNKVEIIQHNAKEFTDFEEFDVITCAGNSVRMILGLIDPR
jgi:hypothetical protein